MKDFDQYWAEQNAEPADIFKLFGKEEQLPPKMPALIILKLLRAQKEYGEKLLPNIVWVDLAITLFTEEKLQEWAEKGLTADQMVELVQWAMSAYGGNAKAVQEETGKA